MSTIIRDAMIAAIRRHRLERKAGRTTGSMRKAMLAAMKEDSTSQFAGMVKESIKRHKKQMPINLTQFESRAGRVR